MVNIQSIHPLTDFLRNHKQHVKRLKKTKKPEALTINGRPEIVLMDAGSYQRLAENLAEMETIAAIREGIEAAERGEVKPAEQVFKEMKARYGLAD